MTNRQFDSVVAPIAAFKNFREAYNRDCPFTRHGEQRSAANDFAEALRPFPILCKHPQTSWRSEVCAAIWETGPALSPRALRICPPAHPTTAV